MVHRLPRIPGHDDRPPSWTGGRGGNISRVLRCAGKTYAGPASRRASESSRGATTPQPQQLSSSVGGGGGDDAPPSDPFDDPFPYSKPARREKTLRLRDAARKRDALLRSGVAAAAAKPPPPPAAAGSPLAPVVVLPPPPLLQSTAATWHVDGEFAAEAREEAVTVDLRRARTAASRGGGILVRTVGEGEPSSSSRGGLRARNACDRPGAALIQVPGGPPDPPDAAAALGLLPPPPQFSSACPLLQECPRQGVAKGVGCRRKGGGGGSYTAGHVAACFVCRQEHLARMRRLQEGAQEHEARRRWRVATDEEEETRRILGACDVAKARARHTQLVREREEARLLAWLGDQRAARARVEAQEGRRRGATLRQEEECFEDLRTQHAQWGEATRAIAREVAAYECEAAERRVREGALLRSKREKEQAERDARRQKCLSREEETERRAAAAVEEESRTALHSLLVTTVQRIEMVLIAQRQVELELARRQRDYEHRVAKAEMDALSGRDVVAAAEVEARAGLRRDMSAAHLEVQRALRAAEAHRQVQAEQRAYFEEKCGDAAREVEVEREEGLAALAKAFAVRKVRLDVKHGRRMWRMRAEQREEALMRIEDASSQQRERRRTEAAEKEAARVAAAAEATDAEARRRGERRCAAQRAHEEGEEAARRRTACEMEVRQRAALAGELARLLAQHAPAAARRAELERQEERRRTELERRAEAALDASPEAAAAQDALRALRVREAAAAQAEEEAEADAWLASGDGGAGSEAGGSLSASPKPSLSGGDPFQRGRHASAVSGEGHLFDTEVLPGAAAGLLVDDAAVPRRRSTRRSSRLPIDVSTAGDAAEGGGGGGGADESAEALMSPGRQRERRTMSSFTGPPQSPRAAEGRGTKGSRSGPKLDLGFTGLWVEGSGAARLWPDGRIGLGAKALVRFTLTVTIAGKLTEGDVLGLFTTADSPDETSELVAQEEGLFHADGAYLGVFAYDAASGAATVSYEAPPSTTRRVATDAVEHLLRQLYFCRRTSPPAPASTEGAGGGNGGGSAAATRPPQFRLVTVALEYTPDVVSPRRTASGSPREGGGAKRVEVRVRLSTLPRLLQKCGGVDDDEGSFGTAAEPCAGLCAAAVERVVVPAGSLFKDTVQHPVVQYPKDSGGVFYVRVSMEYVSPDDYAGTVCPGMDLFELGASHAAFDADYDCLVLSSQFVEQGDRPDKIIVDGDAGKVEGSFTMPCETVHVTFRTPGPNTVTRLLEAVSYRRAHNYVGDCFVKAVRCRIDMMNGYQQEIGGTTLDLVVDVLGARRGMVLHSPNPATMYRLPRGGVSDMHGLLLRPPQLLLYPDAVLASTAPSGDGSREPLPFGWFAVQGFRPSDAVGVLTEGTREYFDDEGGDGEDEGGEEAGVSCLSAAVDGDVFKLERCRFVPELAEGVDVDGVCAQAVEDLLTLLHHEASVQADREREATSRAAATRGLRSVKSSMNMLARIRTPDKKPAGDAGDAAAGEEAAPEDPTPPPPLPTAGDDSPAAGTSPEGGETDAAPAAAVATDADADGKPVKKTSSAGSSGGAGGGGGAAGGAAAEAADAAEVHLLFCNKALAAVEVRQATQTLVGFVPGRVSVALAQHLLRRLAFSLPGGRVWRRMRGRREMALRVDLGAPPRRGAVAPPPGSSPDERLALASAVAVAPPILSGGAGAPPAASSAAVAQGAVPKVYREQSEPILLGPFELVDQKGDELYAGAFVDVEVIEGLEPEDVFSLRGSDAEEGAFQLQGVQLGSLAPGPGRLRVNLANTESADDDAGVRTPGVAYHEASALRCHTLVNPPGHAMEACKAGGWIIRVEPHVASILKALSYCTTSQNPQCLHKTVKVSVYDGARGVSFALVEVDVVPVHDITEIAVDSTELLYRQVNGARTVGFSVLPGVVLTDPDTFDFKKGRVSLELVGGGDCSDKLDFVTLEQQEMRYVERARALSKGGELSRTELLASRDLQRRNELAAAREKEAAAEAAAKKLADSKKKKPRQKVARAAPPPPTDAAAAAPPPSLSPDAAEAAGGGGGADAASVEVADEGAERPLPVEEEDDEAGRPWYAAIRPPKGGFTEAEVARRFAEGPMPGQPLPPQLWLTLHGSEVLVNGVAVATISWKGSGIKGAYPVALSLAFTNVHVTPLHVVSYILRCVSYESTSAKTAVSQRLYQLKLNAGDVPVRDSRLRLQITVCPATLWAPAFSLSWKYRERDGPRPVNDHVKYNLTTFAQTVNPAGVKIDSGTLRVTISGVEDKADAICLCPAPEGYAWQVKQMPLPDFPVSAPPTRASVDTGGVAAEPLLPLVSPAPSASLADVLTLACVGLEGADSHGELFGDDGDGYVVGGGKMRTGEALPICVLEGMGTREVVMRFVEGWPVGVKAMTALLHSLAFNNDGHDAAVGLRTVDIRFFEGPEDKWGSTVSTLIDVYATDDPTEVKLKSDKFAYVLGGTKGNQDEAALPLYIATTAVVADPDTPVFAGPEGWLQVSFLSGFSKSDQLSIVPRADIAPYLSIDEATGQITHGGQVVAVVAKKYGGLGRDRLKVLFKDCPIGALQDMIRCLTYVNASRRDTASNRCIGIGVKDGKATQTSRVTISVDLHEAFVDLSGCGAPVPMSKPPLAQAKLSLQSLQNVTCVVSAEAYANTDAAEPLPWPGKDLQLAVGFTGAVTLKNGTELRTKKQCVGSIAQNPSVVEVWLLALRASLPHCCKHSIVDKLQQGLQAFFGRASHSAESGPLQGHPCSCGADTGGQAAPSS